MLILNPSRYKHEGTGSMAIAMQSLDMVFTKYLLNVIKSNDFLKFWRNRLSHERPHLAIRVKFMRPEDVR